VLHFSSSVSLVDQTKIHRGVRDLNIDASYVQDCETFSKAGHKIPHFNFSFAPPMSFVHRQSIIARLSRKIKIIYIKCKLYFLSCRIFRGNSEAESLFQMYKLIEKFSKARCRAFKTGRSIENVWKLHFRLLKAIARYAGADSELIESFKFSVKKLHAMRFADEDDLSRFLPVSLETQEISESLSERLVSFFDKFSPLYSKLVEANQDCIERIIYLCESYSLFGTSRCSYEMKLRIY